MDRHQGGVAVTIRRAQPSDAAILAELRFAFRADLNAPSESEAAFRERCRRWMTERLAASSAWQCWVAEEPTGIIGTVWLQLLEKVPNPIAEPEWHAYLSSLYVVPARRGAGLGSALLEACLRECERRGVDAVILWPTPQSRSLYQRRGFAVREDLLELRVAAIAS